MSRPTPTTVHRTRFPVPAATNGCGYSIWAGDRRLGTVVKTGTHRDDYPWDWLLADGIEPALRPDGRPRKTVGVADRLQSAIDELCWAAGVERYYPVH